MAKKIIIAIDGWSSCGKSTLAKQLAKELGYIYIDSGAMYRAITLYFLRNHIDWTNDEEVKEALTNITLEFLPNPQTGESGIYLNDENVEYVIRDLVVAEKVSDVAAIGLVRTFAVAQQQKMGAGKGIVMDGRDKKKPEMRHYIDSHREVSPLRKADDAIVLDNTDLTMKEQFDQALTLVKKKI